MVTIDVEHEALLVDEPRDRLHVLSPSAALLWRCYDGVSTLAEIADDLAEGLHRGQAEVMAETVEATRHLVAEGVIVDVADRALPATVSEWSDESPRPAALAGWESTAFSVCTPHGCVELRCDDSHALDLLRDILAPLIDGEVASRHTVSLVVGARQGSTQDPHYLYRDDQYMLRTTNFGRLIRAAVAQTRGLGPLSDDVLELNGRVLVSPHGALVCTTAYDALLELPQRRLARLGWRWLDVPRVLVDRGSLELAVLEPQFEVDERALAAANARFPPGPEEAPLVPGRISLQALVALGFVDADEPSPARRVIGLTPFVAVRGRRARAADYEVMARVSGEIRCVRLFSGETDEFPDFLTRLDT